LFGRAPEALFRDPVPGATDSDGNLYIADYENSRVRRIESNIGIVPSVAGSGACPTTPAPLNTTVCQSGFGGDGGLATNAVLNYPVAVALDAAGNLDIADTINRRIRRMDVSTRLIDTLPEPETAASVEMEVSRYTPKRPSQQISPSTTAGRFISPTRGIIASAC
jgi:hypothetical protein